MTHWLQSLNRMVSCLVITVAVAEIVGGAQAEVPDAEQLAQRFRPYYKFSVDNGNSQEPRRPCFLIKAMTKCEKFSKIAAWIKRPDCRPLKLSCMPFVCAWEAQNGTTRSIQPRLRACFL